MTEPLPDAEVYVMTVPGLTEKFQQEIEQRWLAEMPGKKLLILGGGATLAPLSHLDAAWREAATACATLPEKGYGPRLLPVGNGWVATAIDLDTVIDGDGDTPAAALRALAAKLADR